MDKIKKTDSLGRKLLLDELFRLTNPLAYLLSKGKSNASGGREFVRETEESMRELSEFSSEHKDKSDAELRDLHRNMVREPFYNQNNLKPNYELYARKDSWRIEEFIPLILGLNPKVFTWDKVKDKKNDSDKDREYKNTKEIILSTVMENKFGFWRAGSIEYKTITPVEALNWANQKNIEAPLELVGLVSQFHELPEYKNKDQMIEKLMLENEALKRELADLNQLPLMDRFPKYTQQAIVVFSECWDQLPHDMKRPLRENLEAFYKGMFGEDTMMKSVISVAKRYDIPTTGKQEKHKVRSWRRKSDRN